MHETLELKTPLHQAALQGDLSGIEDAILCGADLNNQEHGYTALCVAIKKKQEACAIALLEAGVDPNIRVEGAMGSLPIHLAAEVGSTAIVAWLLKHETDCIHATDSNGNTPLHKAAVCNQHAVVALLIDASTDINVVNHKGVSPLHLAADLAHVSIVSLLLSKQVNVNIKTNDVCGFTPLDLAKENIPQYTMLLSAMSEDTERIEKIKEFIASTRLIVDLLRERGALTGRSLERRLSPGGHASENSCGYCSKEAVNRCSRCKQVFYCGRACQKAHWPQHKRHCNL